MNSKLKPVVFAIILILGCVCPHIRVSASPMALSSYTEELGDGYYAEISVSVSPARTSNCTVYKNYNIFNSSNETVASYKLTATFTFPYNNSALCTAASYETTVSPGWSFSDCSATASGNTATGHFIAKNKLLGVTIRTVEETLTIRCDANGNIS